MLVFIVPVSCEMHASDISTDNHTIVTIHEHDDCTMLRKRNSLRIIGTKISPKKNILW